MFNAPGNRGRKHAEDLRSVVDAMLYIAQTGCQWRYLPESFGRCRRLAKSFENTTTSVTTCLQVACIATTLRHLSQVGTRQRAPLLAA